MRQNAEKNIHLGILIPPVILFFLFLALAIMSFGIDLLSDRLRSFEYILSLSPPDAIFFIIKSLFAGLVLSFLVGLLPSIIYNYLMHYFIFRKIKNRITVIALGGLLGGILVCLPILFILSFSLPHPLTFQQFYSNLQAGLLLSGYGIPVGLISTWILLKIYKTKKT